MIGLLEITSTWHFIAAAIRPGEQVKSSTTISKIHEFFSKKISKNFKTSKGKISDIMKSNIIVENTDLLEIFATLKRIRGIFDV